MEIRLDREPLPLIGVDRLFRFLDQARSLTIFKVEALVEDLRIREREQARIQELLEVLEGQLDEGSS